mmetsp:Transcript_12342/g.39116  ORF Transcript_12342/g.39116 Transcript_12342/m.39116 type:complete len:220 (-) Transcript_12342:1123-1782(-)
MILEGCSSDLMSPVSSSLSVMESMMHIYRLIFAWLSFSRPLGMRSELKPGIMLITCPIGPILRMLANCSYRIRMENLPSASFSSSSGCWSCGITSWILSMNPDQSPRPSSLLTNGLVSKISNSSMCSPVPMKMIGDFVAATADSAPPPLACPSIFVTITAPTSTVWRKALAWSCAAWPIDESITKIVWSGLTTSETARISSNSAVSCLCLPEVSTMIMS